MTSYQIKTCHNDEDYDAICDFFFTIKDELGLPDRQAVQAVCEAVFANGGYTVVSTLVDNKIIGVLGYFFGDPAQDFHNKEVLFLYMAAILPAYRGTTIFRRGLVYTLNEMKVRTSVTHIRLQAEASNPFTNKLYSRFAQPLGRGKSRRGAEVMTYGNTLDEALAKLATPRRSYQQQPALVTV